MSKLMIFYIDYNDENNTKISDEFKNEFKNYELTFQNPESDILQNISHAINNNYKIPLVFIGDRIINKYGNHLFYEIKQMLNLANLIFLSSSNTISNLSTNIKNLGFYNFITKKQLKKNLFVTVNEAIKNYNMNIQLENSYKKDILTGLLNRNALLKDITLLQKPQVLLINIDDFRNVNFTYGYKSGDELLKEFGFVLNRLAPNSAYRLLSDEFVVLCKDLDEEQLTLYAQEIKQTIQEKVFNVDSEEITVTASIAISDNKNSIIEDAREAIRNSMQIHKNRISFVPKTKEEDEEKFSVKNLRLAFAKDRIIPFYQGIRNNKTGEIEKYECLARLKDENDEYVSPNIFLEIANSMGMMSRITKLIIQKSFSFFSQREGEFSINLTEEDLKEQYLLEFLVEESMRYQIDLNRVTFEILENINVENSHIIAEQITKLQNLGCKIAFDDFGCEKSNFSRLLDLNIDIVKIDSMFIKNIHTNPKSYKLTKAITRLAKDFDCQVIAEGVECEEVQKIIEELDIDFTQGYYYSQPQEHV